MQVKLYFFLAHFYNILWQQPRNVGLYFCENNIFPADI